MLLICRKADADNKETYRALVVDTRALYLEDPDLESRLMHRSGCYGEDKNPSLRESNLSCPARSLVNSPFCFFDLFIPFPLLTSLYLSSSISLFISTYLCMYRPMRVCVYVCLYACMLVYV